MKIASTALCFSWGCVGDNRVPGHWKYSVDQKASFLTDVISSWAETNFSENFVIWNSRIEDAFRESFSPYKLQVCHLRGLISLKGLVFPFFFSILKTATLMLSEQRLRNENDSSCYRQQQNPLFSTGSGRMVPNNKYLFIQQALEVLSQGGPERLAHWRCCISIWRKGGTGKDSMTN